MGVPLEVAILVIRREVVWAVELGDHVLFMIPQYTGLGLCNGETLIGG